MIDYSEAIQKILAKATPMDTEQVSLLQALNRVLATPVYSDMNLPPFDKSAMDGYACRKQDISNELTVVETLPAGKQPTRTIGVNECAKIMTGAVVPDGADLVFMQEDAEIRSDNKVKCSNPKTKANICYLGEDIKSGDQVLSAHTLIHAMHLPILAGAGYSTAEVFQQPRIALFSTGTELVEANQKPAPHQIRNTNAIQLQGQLKSMHIDPSYGGILKDENEIIEEKIQKSLSQNELLILTGGVSVGQYDLIPNLLEKMGFEIIIQKTAIQPGRPMIFAAGKNKFCFGLSGNPVSSFIQFELYVKPFIYKIMGYEYRPQRYQLPVKGKITRKKTDRLQFKPAKITGNQIVPIEFHGSAHINSLAHADCLIEVPVGIDAINEGEFATIRILTS